ncbi:ski oncogene-like [Fukomys damarensis]|uniref:ski oncogene-like n=1 Tax=Fukomys damarensis TaxID=885580 RepID=UPI0014551E1B|nr:ski oncogene-like [Fukomys damarensis]
MAPTSRPPKKELAPSLVLVLEFSKQAHHFHGHESFLKSKELWGWSCATAPSPVPMAHVGALLTTLESQTCHWDFHWADWWAYILLSQDYLHEEQQTHLPCCLDNAKNFDNGQQVQEGSTLHLIWST